MCKLGYVSPVLKPVLGVQEADDARVQQLRVETLLSAGDSDVLLYDRLHIAIGEVRLGYVTLDYV